MTKLKKQLLYTTHQTSVPFPHYPKIAISIKLKPTLCLNPPLYNNYNISDRIVITSYYKFYFSKFLEIFSKKSESFDYYRFWMLLAQFGFVQGLISFFKFYLFFERIFI